MSQETTNLPSELCDIHKMSATLQNLSKIAADIAISDIESAQNALRCALQSRKLGQTLEESRKEMLKPHLDYQRFVTKLVKDFNDKLDEIEKKMHEGLAQWMEQQAKSPFTMLEEIKVADGTISRKNVFTFNIESPESVPSEYLIVDQKAIAEAVKNGVRNIPGVNIFESVQTSLRIKN